MRVLVSGSRGLIGSAVVSALAEEGHTPVRLVRSEPEPGSPAVRWDPAAGTVDTAALEALGGVDAVVHLAGEGIAERRWTPEQKQRIRDSRVLGTRTVAAAAAALAAPPSVFACASAIGCYGDRGDEVLTEESAPGTGFLAEVCREWEAAVEPAVRRGIRVANLRFGIVLSPEGGALAQMLPIFRTGAGGPLGSGRQWVSWVHIDDVVGGVRHVLATEGLGGPVNVVAPEPVRNREFARTLGEVLGRPSAIPAPAFALRLRFGEFADEALLASQRVLPARLEASGYRFRFPELEDALRHLLGR